MIIIFYDAILYIMASKRPANCPVCPGSHKHHPHHQKQKVGDCPPVDGQQWTKAWQDYWKRGSGASRDLCVHTQGPDSTQGPGWQDIYRCYLGSPPSKELVKQYGPIPACYKNGKPTHVPKPSPASGPSSTHVVPKTPAQNQCASLLPFGDGTTDGTPALLSDIKYFQDQEMSLLNEIQAEAANPGNVDENKISTWTGELKVYQDARIRLMNQLKNVSTQTQCSLASDRIALQDQLAMTMIAEDQLKIIEKETQDLINERNNKHRMVEITNYEYDRFSSHKDIFRTIAFCSLFVLAGIYIGASGNDTFSFLGYPIVVIAIAVAIFLTIKKIWWNYYRNERNWKQFDWDMPHPHSKNYETVWQHDKRAFEKAWHDTEYEADQAEKWGEQEYQKAKTTVKKAYKDTKKDIKSAASDASKGVQNLTGGSKSKRETFAPFR